jgi:nucleotide-binding universal stress UspA family protein
MSPHDTQPVVVGVPDDDVDDTLRFAVQEASRHDCGIHLVHTHEPGQAAWGAEVLRRVRARAEDLAPALPVSGQLVAGMPVDALLAAAADARLAVVRRRDILHLFRILTGERAAAARVPVVCVPPGWDVRADDQRPVTVGVEYLARAEGLLRAATLLAAERATRLRVLHVQPPPRRTDRIFEDRLGAEWDATVRADLEHALARCGAESTTSIDVQHGQPAVALLAAAAGSQLLVLGRNDPAALGGPRLGRAARAVLHDSPAPVLLVPPATRPAQEFQVRSTGFSRS